MAGLAPLAGRRRLGELPTAFMVAKAERGGQDRAVLAQMPEYQE